MPTNCKEKGPRRLDPLLNEILIPTAIYMHGREMFVFCLEGLKMLSYCYLLTNPSISDQINNYPHN